MKTKQFKEDGEEQKQEMDHKNFICASELNHDSHPPCVQVVVALVDCFCHLLHPGGIILLVYSN
jgi:hypothetical protein